MQTLNDEEQGRCKTSVVLFGVLSEKFKPWHNETLLPLQYCKLIRQESVNAEEWMDCLKIRANECEYKEKRIIKEQFINGINEDVMKEIIQS